MLIFVLNTVFWTLAFYGLFELIKNIIYIGSCTKFKTDGIRVIIAVKNQEDKIEGLLKSIIFKILYGKEDIIENILVVDLKSKDRTREIINKMSQDNEIIKEVNWKECKEIIDSVNEK